MILCEEVISGNENKFHTEWKNKVRYYVLVKMCIYNRWYHYMRLSRKRIFMRFRHYKLQQIIHDRFVISGRSNVSTLSVLKCWKCNFFAS